MEKELLEMTAQWKQTALEMIQKSESGSRSEMVNQMLFACAEMVEWKVKQTVATNARTVAETTSS
jgi:hypothetical protein